MRGREQVGQAASRVIGFWLGDNREFEAKVLSVESAVNTPGL